MKLSDMNKDERSLLLFFETCAVDFRGAIKTQHMNNDDFDIAKRWNKEGFIKFGRIAYGSLPLPSGATHWCELSNEAWMLAHGERLARAKRNESNRTWVKSCDKNVCQT